MVNKKMNIIFKVMTLFFISSINQIALATGDAGCGLGSMIISKNSKLLQLFALTTNGSFSSQPIGITFGTSNCSSNGIVSNEKEMIYYVEINHNEIMKEIAMGKGEKADTLANMVGCKSEKSKSQFIEVSKRNFENLNMGEKYNSTEWLSQLKNIMKDNHDHLNECELS